MCVFLSTFRTDAFLVHMKSLYVIVQVPYSVKFCVTELTVYDTLSVMFYVFILPIKLLVTFCTGILFIIVNVVELHGQNDSKCSMIGFF